MSTNIYQFNNNLLVTVADGTLNTSAAPIAFPGKGYSNYGAPVMQDVLWVMQNFAGAITPTPSLQGMCWYDTGSNSLKLYTGSTWNKVFKDNQDNLPATDGTYALGSSAYKFTNVVSNTLTAQSADPGAAAGPNVVLYRASSSPAANDYVGQILFNGNNTSSNTVKYGFIAAKIITATSGSTRSNLEFGIQHNATESTVLVLENDLTTSMLYDASVGGKLTVTGDIVSTAGDMYATVFHGVATSAQYADVAERYESDAVLEVGDVVVIGGEEEVTKSTIDSDVNVFGVVSDKPALKMNDKAGNDKTHPLIALLGRTPCKVIGPVGKGQRLVASDIPGVARAAHGTETSLSILGRSLNAKTSDSIELVEIVIGRS